MKRGFWVFFSILIIAFLAIAGMYAFANLPGRSMSWANATSSQGIGSLPDLLKSFMSSKEMTLVVFGRPGENYNGGNLADSIVVMHFNPDKNTVHLISIPRDLWIADNNEQFKINEVLNKKKVPDVLDKIENITGYKPDGYVIIDLALIRDAVDYMGGVDIVLHEAAMDWVSGYTMEAGPHHLNGEDAIWLVRNRFNPEGDFFREGNQQQIIGQLFSKFKALSKEKKLAFFKKFVLDRNLLQNAKIDLTQLAPYLFDTDISSIKLQSVTLDFTTKLLRSASIPLQSMSTTTYISALVPTAGFENYSQIRTYIQDRTK
jgi:LCP family protein required for cell wall assembly